MNHIPVIAIFDIGKTNKKLFLFNENYHIVYEKSVHLAETTDEDGFPCENLDSLNSFIFDTLNEVFEQTEFEIKAINFSAYGASFVNIGHEEKPISPLYNYLKPYPIKLSKELYNKYGGEETFSPETASPALGSLNSGLQLYRLKNENPEVFNKLKFALHLPQYMSFLLTGKYHSEITSIGCHTALWDFSKKQYHQWVEDEGLLEKLAPIQNATQTAKIDYNNTIINVGIGLHDSSAALVPYLMNFQEPFILISTGTWSISLNPFNHSTLTVEELKEDCLCYLQYQGKPVKASRLFLGHMHQQQCERIAKHFNQDVTTYQGVKFSLAFCNQINKNYKSNLSFEELDLTTFSTYEEAYYGLMIYLVNKQCISTKLILKNSNVKRIFVDGGFSKNSLFMNMLAQVFPEMEVFAATMAQASALGAALVIHDNWNKNSIPADMVSLNYYKVL
jgi:sugar (pentulose or hexulose) kinase